MFGRIIVTVYRIVLVACIMLLFGGVLFQCSNPNPKHRLIHNNDGTDALGNLWFNKRPLSVADINAYVDVVANSQVTTYMMCSGSDFLFYRSKYGRVFGDDLSGKLNCGVDTLAYKNYNKYYKNFQNLECSIENGLKIIRILKSSSLIDF